MSVYANAADVLPSELLKAVQKHWRGLLYIPPVNYKSKADCRIWLPPALPSARSQIWSDSPHGGFIKSRRKTGNSRCTHEPSVTSSVTFVEMTEKFVTYFKGISSPIEA